MSNTASRRNFLAAAAHGVGGLTLSILLPGGGVLAAPVDEPLAPREPHFSPKARAVIWLHMDGAPSSLDLYDYKPELVRLAGQETPASFLAGVNLGTAGGRGKLFASSRTWQQHGESGAWLSDLLPNLAQHADELAFIKSSKTSGATH